MKISVHGATDLGRKRTVNEDNFKICPEAKLFLVADGMGGHLAGEIASKLAVEIVAESVNSGIGCNTEAVDCHPGHLLRQSIQLANKKILETAQNRPELEGMGTTIIAVYIVGRTLHIASVGDSRIYRIRDDQDQLLTTDHSWVSMQVKLGNLTPEESRYHPMRNVITRALGTQKNVEVDIDAHLIQENDSILMCTDGLSNLVVNSELKRIITDHIAHPDICNKQLINLANNRGGDDNITALTMHFTGTESDISADNDTIDCVANCDVHEEQDTAVIPKQELQRRLNLRQFPKFPP